MGVQSLDLLTFAQSDKKKGVGGSNPVKKRERDFRPENHKNNKLQGEIKTLFNLNGVIS